MEDRVSTGHHGFWVRMAALAAVGLLLCAFFVPPLSDGWFAVPFCFLFILTVFCRNRTGGGDLHVLSGSADRR